MNDVTRILSQMESGAPPATDELLPLVYDELRQLAVAKLAHEKPGQTLQATCLVHEAYLRLVQTNQPVAWENRRHFFAAAAEAMRRILIERARRRNSEKHGGNHNRVDVEPDLIAAQCTGDFDILALDEALEELAARDKRKAQLVQLRLYAGLTLDEAAAALDISLATAKRDWLYARAWLYGRLADLD